MTESGVLHRGRRVRTAILFVIAAALAALAAIAFFTQDEDEPPPLGDLVEIGAATHITDQAGLQIPQGDPPAGGPHFPTPLRQGIYDSPVADGNAIHSLEHGMVWISYNPSLIAPGDLNVMREVSQRFSRDVVLSPRPENQSPVTAVSWGRILRLQQADRETLEDFVESNRNQSPEPGLR